jgi:hypothetical protein
MRLPYSEVSRAASGREVIVLALRGQTTDSS